MTRATATTRVGVREAPVSGTPYMLGMSDWEVMTPVPSQGPAIARHAFPARWRDGNMRVWHPGTNVWSAPSNTSDTDFYNNKTFTDYSGGVFDPLARKLYFHGGGHSASYCNAVMVFDFNGQTAPRGWLTIDNAASDDQRITVGVGDLTADLLNLDGKPMSVHTYDQHCFDSLRKRYYRFGGACQGSPTQAHGCFYLDTTLPDTPDVNPWRRITANNNSKIDNGGCAIVAPDSSKVFVWAPATGMFFVTLADTPEGHSRVGVGMPPITSESYPAICHDTTNAEYLVTLRAGSSGGVRLYRVLIDWSAGSVQVDRATFTGADGQDISAFSPWRAGLIYDEGRDCFWSFAPSGSSTVTRLWEIKRTGALTYTIGQHVLPTPVFVGAGSLLGKHAWFPQERVLAMCGSTYEPLKMLKIPL